MQKIVTHLWFDSQAEEAARFYALIFKNSKLLNISRYSEAAAAISGRGERFGDDGGVSTGTSDLPRVERWSDIQIQQGYFPSSGLRRSNRTG